MEEHAFRGYYRRSNDSSLFQPCGDARFYRVTGLGEPLALLRERFRYTTVYMGLPLFAVFRGNLVTDTIPAGRGARGLSGDTTAARPEIVTRFFLVRLDSLRPREPGDCRMGRGQ